MTIVNSIEEALDLLKGSNDDDTENLDAEDEEISDVYAEKGQYDLDLVKAEDDNEILELVKADSFMTALLQNQDYNVSKLEKAITANMQATETVLTIMKGFSNNLESLTDRVNQIAGTPQPAKGALSRQEAESLAKGEVVGSKGEPNSEVLTKGLVVDTLEKGMIAGEVSERDVCRAESAFSSYEAMTPEMLNVLSPEALKYLKANSVI